MGYKIITNIHIDIPKMKFSKKYYKVPHSILKLPLTSFYPSIVL